TLDGDPVLPDGLDRVVDQPLAELVEALLAGVDLEPDDLPLAAVRLLHGGVDDRPCGRPDVRAGAVALDDRDDGVVRDHAPAVLHGDLLAFGRGQLGKLRHDSTSIVLCGLPGLVEGPGSLLETARARYGTRYACTLRISASGR